MAVYYSFIKHHKLKRRVELKERKILEILKNYFAQFYNLINDNCQLHTSYGLKIIFKLMYYFISTTTFMETTFLYCVHVEMLF